MDQFGFDAAYSALGSSISAFIDGFWRTVKYSVPQASNVKVSLKRRFDKRLANLYTELKANPEKYIGAVKKK